MEPVFQEIGYERSSGAKAQSAVKQTFAISDVNTEELQAQKGTERQSFQLQFYFYNLNCIQV